MTKKNYSRDGFFRDQYRCVVDGGDLANTIMGDLGGTEQIRKQDQAGLPK